MPRPVVVHRSSTTITVPGEEGDAIVIESIGFVQPLGTDRRDYRKALGLIDDQDPWVFHESESLVVAVRTIAAP